MRNAAGSYSVISEPLTVPATADADGRYRLELDFAIAGASSAVVTINSVQLSPLPYGVAPSAGEVGIDTVDAPILEFHASLAGLTGTISYKPLGSVLSAGLLNALQNELIAAETALDTGRAYIVTLQGQVTTLQGASHTQGTDVGTSNADFAVNFTGVDQNVSVSFSRHGVTYPARVKWDKTAGNFVMLAGGANDTTQATVLVDTLTAATAATVGGQAVVVANNANLAKAHTQNTDTQTTATTFKIASADPTTTDVAVQFGQNGVVLQLRWNATTSKFEFWNGTGSAAAPLNVGALSAASLALTTPLPATQIATDWAAVAHTGTTNGYGLRIAGQNHTSADTVAELASLKLLGPSKMAGTITTAITLDVLASTAGATNRAIRAMDSVIGAASDGTGGVLITNNVQSSRPGISQVTGDYLELGLGTKAIQIYSATADCYLFSALALQLHGGPRLDLKTDSGNGPINLVTHGTGAVVVQPGGNLNITAGATTLGVLGAAAVAKAAATADIKDSLVAFGFLTDSGATPLNLDGGALTAGVVTATNFRLPTSAPGTPGIGDAYFHTDSSQLRIYDGIQWVVVNP